MRAPHLSSAPRTEISRIETYARRRDLRERLVRLEPAPRAADSRHAAGAAAAGGRRVEAAAGRRRRLRRKRRENTRDLFRAARGADRPPRRVAREDEILGLLPAIRTAIFQERHGQSPTRFYDPSRKRPDSDAPCRRDVRG